jgi:hypothetical protein
MAWGRVCRRPAFRPARLAFPDRMRAPRSSDLRGVAGDDPFATVRNLGLGDEPEWAEGLDMVVLLLWMFRHAQP